MSELDDAARELEREIDDEAVRLIKLGVPKWDAIIQARQRVTQRRRDAARRSGEYCNLFTSARP